jgi:hypothetical protein
MTIIFHGTESRNRNQQRQQNAVFPLFVVVLQISAALASGLLFNVRRYCLPTGRQFGKAPPDR